MDWITKQIAIGNFIDVKNPPGNIDAILCLKDDCCKGRKDLREDLDLYCIPMVDGEGNSAKSILNAIKYIDDIVALGGKILAHCHAGRSRSVTIVARYLMVFCSMTASQALELIAQKREIYLSPGIEDILFRRLHD